MGVDAGLYMCDVLNSSRSLSHLLMSSCRLWRNDALVNEKRGIDATATLGSLGSLLHAKFGWPWSVKEIGTGATKIQKKLVKFVLSPLGWRNLVENSTRKTPSCVVQNSPWARWKGLRMAGSKIQNLRGVDILLWFATTRRYSRFHSNQHWRLIYTTYRCDLSKCYTVDDLEWSIATPNRCGKDGSLSAMPPVSIRR